MRAKTLAWLLLVVAGLMAPALASAQDIAALERQVTMFTLSNGLRFIVVHRSEAPIFSYVSVAKAGSVDEVPGITGLAHMFEHMAFKGTDVIGTKDFGKERKALELMEERYAAWWNSRLAGADEVTLAALWQQFKDSEAKAGEYVETNQFGSIVERAGGSGLNASTAPDVTTYYYNLPANQLELWAYLESERFMRPVLREFYKERDVVLEERRMRTESSPIGRLIEDYLCTAFKAHPYGAPTVGHHSDLTSFTSQDADAFYRKYYVPGNIVVCLVGDVDPAQVQALAQKYFGSWQAAPIPEPVRTVEPPQSGERRVELRDPGQPFLAVGFHKPGARHPDHAAYQVLTQLLANGRSSRLHQLLVKDQKKAVAVGAITEFPGELYPGLLTVFAVPSKGVTAKECEEVVLDQLERLKEEPVTGDELEGIKTRMKADWVRSVESNTGMANLLASSEVVLGSWKEGLRWLQKIDAVTAADLQRVAKETFTVNNRTVGLIITEEEGSDDAS
jgi:predicted Zn-dependent peptidase